MQWVAGGAVAEAVIARNGGQIVLVMFPESERKAEPNLASTAMAELRFAGAPRKQLADDAAGRRAFAQAIEEWKLLMACALAGLSREAIQLAAAYARERLAFGQPIGSYQGISHPLADLISDVDGGKYFNWKTIRDIADGKPEAGAEISLALWWNADTANRAVAQALQTFGGYGLTTDYDIHLYNLRAKAWPLIFGDPQRLLEEAGRRFYAGESAALPDAGAVTIDFDLGDEARALAAELDAFFRKNLTPSSRRRRITRGKATIRGCIARWHRRGCCSCPGRRNSAVAMRRRMRAMPPCTSGRNTTGRLRRPASPAWSAPSSGASAATN